MITWNVLLPGILSAIPLLWLQETDAPQTPGSPADRQNQDRGRIEGWIRDLGQNDAQGEAAKKELLRIGPPAIPYLKEAAKDPDAERALAARGLLRQLAEGKDRRREGMGEVTVVYHDWPRGIDFTREENGHLTLTVPEKNAAGKREFKTYQADSLADFTKRYPEVSRTYHVAALASPKDLSEEMRRQWERVRDWLGLEGRSGEDDERALDTWLEREENRLEQHWDACPNPEESTDGGKHQATLGVLVSAAGPTLRSQLGLGESGALVIHSVSPKSVAEAAGLRKHDLITRLNDQPIKDAASFREEVAAAIQKGPFTLGILRSGKSQTMTVKPSEVQH
ncbi:MAG TPA: PDZ domain-containing protein [Planctomycetota bacterium]|nr:PDZ domain-containing protein [Planctomycetota bacterium]